MNALAHVQAVSRIEKAIERGVERGVKRGISRTRTNLPALGFLTTFQVLGLDKDSK